jgi:hypothetical protein
MIDRARASDPVIDAYKKHVDRTILRQNLRKTVEERLANLVALQRLAEEARRAAATSKTAR